MERFRFMMNGVKHEYHEGKQAERISSGWRGLFFGAPKVAAPKKQPKAKPKRRKTHGSDKG